MCKWLILSVKVRMAILGKAPGIAIYWYARHELILMGASP